MDDGVERKEVFNNFEELDKFIWSTYEFAVSNRDMKNITVFNEFIKSLKRSVKVKNVEKRKVDEHIEDFLYDIYNNKDKITSRGNNEEQPNKRLEFRKKLQSETDNIKHEEVIYITDKDYFEVHTGIKNTLKRLYKERELDDETIINKVMGIYRTRFEKSVENVDFEKFVRSSLKKIKEEGR